MNGSDGRDGVDGKVGPKGDRGDKGDRGEPGARGEPGRDGRDGSDGLTGPQGAPGADGRDGQAGRGIASVAIDGTSLIVVFDDGTQHDAGILPQLQQSIDLDGIISATTERVMAAVSDQLVKAKQDDEALMLDIATRLSQVANNWAWQAS